MKTTKPFSTISYNTTDFLKSRLDDLITKNVLYFYSFIYHIKEEDETKDHIHLLMRPNGQVDTDKILKYLEEYDPKEPTKPLRCRPPHKTNFFGDWYLYNLHDKDYLLAHGYQTRKYHYQKEDFIVSDIDELNDLIHTIDYKKMYGNRNFFIALDKGTNIFDMVKQNIIPMQQYNAFANFIKDHIQFSIDRTFRGLNVGSDHEHDPLIDSDGVVLENEPSGDIQGVTPCSVAETNTDKEILKND